MEQELLTVPQEQQWDDYISNIDDYPACSGLSGGCECCNKKMYPRRQQYASSWMNVYVANREAIKDGRARIGKLRWISASTAKWCTLGPFHKTRCTTNLSIAECECECALLLKTMLDEVGEGDTAVSLNIIYPLFLKTMKQSRPK